MFPYWQRRTTVRTIADTDAMMFTLPKNVVDQLGIDVICRASFALANGERKEMPIAGIVIINARGRLHIGGFCESWRVRLYVAFGN